MDWITLLRAQQADFIQRLKLGFLLHSEKEGLHGELTVISGNKLKQLRDFCWEMVGKYRPNDPKKYFINSMKGKLGEEVVKLRLGSLVTEVDYEKRIGGDGKVDFTLSSDSSVGIQVKARYGNIDTVKWFINKEEVEKNTVLICILIQEEVNEAQNQYNLVLTGFLPTHMIKVSDNKASFTIEQLLYCGGLNSYLKNITITKNNHIIKNNINLLFKNSTTEHDFPKSVINSTDRHREVAINDCFKEIIINPNLEDYYLKQGILCFEKEDNQSAIQNYTEAIKINPKFAKAYFHRGIARDSIGDKLDAIQDLTKAIQIIPNYVEAYLKRGIILNDMEDKSGAINDYNNVIKFDPNNAYAYLKRGIARYQTGGKQGAIKDYSKAIKINPKFADAYFYRGAVLSDMGHKAKARDDIFRAKNLYSHQGKQEKSQQAASIVDAISEQINSEIPF